MVMQLVNGGASTLSAELDNDDTSLSVTSAASFPSAGVFRVRIGDEILKVTGVSSNTFTVVRGQEGTTAAGHGNGVEVTNVLTAQHVRDLLDERVISDTFANLPAAGVPGRLFLNTDGFTAGIDNGTSWDLFGPLMKVTPPTSTDLSVTLNASTLTLDESKGVFTMKSTAVASGVIARLKSLSGATTWTMIAGLMVPVHSDNHYAYGGLVAHDSANDQGVLLGFCQADAQQQVAALGLKYNVSAPGSATLSANSSWLGNIYGEMAQTNMLMVKWERTATKDVYSRSYNGGGTWVQIDSVNKTYTPDHIGLFLNAHSGVPHMTCFHWSHS